jgi:hypothetical protein
MFEFSYLGRSVDISIEGCFEPNLTTKIMLNATIKCLSVNEIKYKSLLEVGCGSGVMSAYLLKHRLLNSIENVCMSDLSDQAIKITKKNILDNLLDSGNPEFEFKVGPGLKIWDDYQFDIIINDISAISEAIMPMNDWFANAPNNAGIDGVANSIQVLREFSAMPQSNAIMLMPVLSLSNIQILMNEIKNLGLEFQKIVQQSWPLPRDMVNTHNEKLFQLRNDGHINFEEKFGNMVVETACYKVWKVER